MPTIALAPFASASSTMRLITCSRLSCRAFVIPFSSPPMIDLRPAPNCDNAFRELGPPRLAVPGRLIASARRVYGATLDTLFGEPQPVPAANVHVAEDHVVGLGCFPAPGHASHHVCYLHEDGTLYAGDACGVRIQPARDVLPPTPPPDVDVNAWYATIDEIERRAPARLALVHFGVAEDVNRHLDDLRRRLGAWAELVGRGATETDFTHAALADVEHAE